MNRYVIERDILGIGKFSREQFKEISAKSLDALARLTGIQWVQSYVAENKTFCIYLADSEDLIREHSRLAGFPVTKVTVALTVIDPMTAFS
jgi:uncharacterized protein DUF4242